MEGARLLLRAAAAPVGLLALLVASSCTAGQVPAAPAGQQPVAVAGEVAAVPAVEAATSSPAASATPIPSPTAATAAGVAPGNTIPPTRAAAPATPMPASPASTRPPVSPTPPPAAAAPPPAPTPAPPTPRATAAPTAPPPPSAAPTPAAPAPAEAGRTTASWVQRVVDFPRGQATRVQVASGEGVRLAALDGGFAPEGEFLSEVREAGFPFDNAVLSWNAEAAAGTSVRFELRVRGAEGWSGWYAMGEWRAEGGRSVAGQRDARGRVDVDTLKLTSPATALQYRAQLATTSPGSSPLVRLVSVVYADLRAGLAGPSVPKPAARDLEVPRHAQWEQNPAVAASICSPTSLAMVLHYWDLKKTVPEVVEGVRDRTTGIFGNWPLNTAYAGALGFEARVDRFYSMEQVEQEVAAGRPVMVSITYARGEMAGFPNKAAPAGHLIVVRGFTPEGDVIVNDPDAPSSGAVRVVYQRESLGRIWQRSGGIVYLVSPRSR